MIAIETTFNPRPNVVDVSNNNNRGRYGLQCKLCVAKQAIKGPPKKQCKSIQTRKPTARLIYKVHILLIQIIQNLLLQLPNEINLDA